ncbi:MAG: hypothetical protein ACFCVA_04950 [Gammaproteobacteria bacterium]
MAIRIKSTWHHSQRNRPSQKSLEDNAGALAFITWRLSLEGAKRLHGEGFNYLTDKERVGVISEFVAFLVHSTDRLAHGQLDDEDRELFINALGQRLANQMQDNLVDIAGPGNYRRPFIALLNDRLAGYAQQTFRDGEPGYDFLRYFGSQVLKIMGEDQTNRWVIDQIMDVQAPEAFRQLKKSLANLLTSMSG